MNRFLAPSLLAAAASLATSARLTYLPISRRNCSIDRYGRYSSNSCRIRGPTPGMSSISCALAVFKSIGFQRRVYTLSRC